jgi:hypothetical protein
MLPAPILAERREKARNVIEERPTNRTAAAIVAALWISVAALAILFMAWVIWVRGAPRGVRRGMLRSER